MNSITATDRTHSGTLVATVVDTVTFPLNFRFVTVTNRSTSAEIFVRTDHVAPTVGGDGSFVIAAGQSLVIPHMSRPDEPAQGIVNPLVVGLISSGVPTYTVAA